MQPLSSRQPRVCAVNTLRRNLRSATSGSVAKRFQTIPTIDEHLAEDISMLVTKEPHATKPHEVMELCRQE